MSTATVTVNPDRVLADKLLRESPRPLHPIRLRAKLKAAGLDPNLARAQKPLIPWARIDFERMATVADQERWTRMLIQMCERKR